MSRGRGGGRGRGRRRGYGPTGFEEHGGYMSAKIAKLSDQFSRAASSVEKEKGIFSGVAIFVNGYTEPTAEELKRIMMVNGGVYHHYYSRSKTTHIIASNLPDTKVKNMNTDRIVNPKWISESLKAGYLLDYTKFLLYTNQSTNQPKLPFKRISSTEEKVKREHTMSADLSLMNSSENSKDFFQCKSEENSQSSWVYHSEDEDLFSESADIENNQNEPNATTKVEVTKLTTLLKQEPTASNISLQMPVKAEQTAAKENLSKEHSMSTADPKFLPCKSEGIGPSECSAQSSLLYHSEDEDLFSESADIDNKVKITEHITPQKHESAVPNICPQILVKSEQPVPKISPSKGHSMSTANPKFLSEFYNNSRLHHISTMGAMFKQYVTEMQSKKEGFPGQDALKEWIAKTREGGVINGIPSYNINNPGVNTSTKSKRTIMHIDMDCFFVSVGLRNHPELRGIPVAVTHSRGGSRTQAREGSNRQYELNYYKERAEQRLKGKMRPTTGNFGQNSTSGTGPPTTTDSEIMSASDTAPKISTFPLIDETCSMSEIASCSYEARQAGVRNGMFMGPALKLCPNLRTIPYDFEGYKEVAYKLYNIVASFTHDIEAVSCDEMFVDLTELLNSCQVTPLEFASFLRQEVQNATGCPCSCGIGPNMLIARMATRRAKPNGQYLADPDRLAEYMLNEKVDDLPGVGWSMGKRLESEKIKTCGDLQKKSLGQLQALFGSKTGQSLYYYCRGIDDRPIRSEHMRKSVSAEVNYGIRFKSAADAERFIRELSVEVENRLASVKLKGKCITLKLKIRAKDAPVETAKFMGHGVCDNVAKSVSLTSATSSATAIEREVLSLMRQIKVPPEDFRGVGIQVSRLEGHQGSSSSTSLPGSSSIKNFLLSAKSNNSRKSQNMTPDTCQIEKSGASDSSVYIAANSISPQPEPSTSAQVPGPYNRCPTPSEPESSTHTAQGTIDMEVLMALPEDMRDQVIAEYKQLGYAIPESYRESSSKTSGFKEPQPSTSFASPYIDDNVKEVMPSENKLLHKISDPPEVASVDSDGSDHEALVTSFSQVDSSFLAAIPAEMREELRMDFEYKKRVASSSANHVKQGVRTNDMFHQRSHNDGHSSKGLPVPQVRIGKKRGRKPKSMTVPNKRSPVKSSKKNVIVSPKKIVATKRVTSATAYPESNISSHDSELGGSTVSSSTESTSGDSSSKGLCKEEIPQLCGAVEFNEVKAIIREWVSSCPNPEEEDVDIIANYYTSLIIYRDLERLDLLVKYLYRQVIRTQNKVWQLSFNSIVERIQTVMMDNYEAKLKVKTIVIEDNS